VGGQRFNNSPNRTGCPQASGGLYSVLVISSDSACYGKHCQTSTFRDIERLAEDVSIYLANGGVCDCFDWIWGID
jgi:hypothetical protein